MWRSTRFLSGIRLPDSENLDTWLLITSQELEAKRQRLLERLIDHDTAAGDVEEAIHWLQVSLEDDETNESLQYRLLSLLEKQQRYSEALNLCTHLQEIYEREGYAELPAGLASLCQRIREAAATPLSQDLPTWPSFGTMQVPFVGRQQILQEMQRAYRRSGSVIVLGETGSGKSRLARELYFSLKPAPRLLLAPARALEDSLPFQPLIDMLRHSITADEWKQMNPVWVTPLSWLLPELSILRPELSPNLLTGLAPQQANQLIFEALRQALIILSRKQRLLFFVDNAQWCDPDTMASLVYLTERGFFRSHSMLVLAARPEEQNLHLEDFLNHARNAFPIKSFELPPLNAEEITSLSHYILGSTVTPKIIQRLERETGGNPMFLLETLRLMIEYSLDEDLSETAEHLPLAPSIQAVARERMQHLTLDTQQVLSMAAIIGSEFTVSLLEKTALLPSEQVAQALEELERVHLVKATPRDLLSGEYTFVHEKIRQSILLDLSLARKRLMHLRVARALEQKEKGQSIERELWQASHYEEAGELEAAFKHWLSAGSLARQQKRYMEAQEALQRAEALLLRLGPQAPDPACYTLYSRWIQLASEQADVETLEQVCQQMLAVGQQRRSPLLVGSAYSGLAHAAELQKEPQKGLELLETALPYLKQASHRGEQMEAHNRRGVLWVLLNEYELGSECISGSMGLRARSTRSRRSRDTHAQRQPACPDRHVNGAAGSCPGGCRASRPGCQRNC